jgi:hypothetical protein
MLQYSQLAGQSKKTTRKKIANRLKVFIGFNLAVMIIIKTWPDIYQAYS